MRSDHLLDPEVRPALEMFPPLQFSRETLPGIRALMLEQLQARRQPADAAVSVEVISIQGPSGAPPVSVMCYRPTAVHGLLGAILHIHGGGYVIGTPLINDAANQLLAKELKCAVFSVDYRLAPETKYPGAIEDCYAALRWLHLNAKALGIDSRRIGVKGESAGGGLAAALALLARDRGEFPIAFQHLIYPMIDDRGSHEADPHPYTGEFVWTREQNAFGWSCLLTSAPGAEDVSPYAAAARATDLKGLPPTFMYVGTLDVFLDEDVDYAMRLTRAGVPVELHVYPGVFHGFEMAAEARVTAAAARMSIESLRKALG